jgi:hypothetical protein
MNYPNDFIEGGKILNLENSLTRNLKPVRPNPVFISSLRQKLASGPVTLLEKRHDYFGLLALGLGVVFTALIVLMFRRSR